MSDVDTSAEAVERLAKSFDRGCLYDGGGEESALPEEAAATLRALLHPDSGACASEREQAREHLKRMA